MNMAALLRDPMFGEPLVIVRRIERLVKGRATVAVTEEAALGVVQPAQGKDLERLPEADRDKGTIAVFTESSLGVGDDTTSLKADGVLWQGIMYTVTSVEAWPKYGYCKALCQREGAA